MSQQETEPQGETPDDPANLRQALKDQGKVNSDLRQENERLVRTIAFAEAGVPEDGAGKYFREAYGGEMDAEAIKAVAIADGIIGPEAPAAEETPAPPAVPDDELAAIDRIGSTGDAPEGAMDPDSLESSIRNASSADEVMDIVRPAGMAPPR